MADKWLWVLSRGSGLLPKGSYACLCVSCPRAALATLRPASVKATWTIVTLKRSSRRTQDLSSRPAGATIPAAPSPRSRREGPPSEGRPHCLSRHERLAQLNSGQPSAGLAPRGNPVPAKLASSQGTGKAADKMSPEWVWPAGLWPLRAAGHPSIFSARHRSQVPSVCFRRDIQAWPVPPCLAQSSPHAGALAGQEGGSLEWPAHSSFLCLQDVRLKFLAGICSEN